LKKSQVTTTQQGTITITVDDLIKKITVNGVDVPLPAGFGHLSSTASSIQTQIRPGDEIAITGVNTGGPAGILATITYFNEQGKIVEFNTGAGWTCDGVAAKVQGANGVAPWLKISGVSPNAQWIWNPAFPATTTCKNVVPRSVAPATILVTADNQIDAIYINGKLATYVSGDVKKWEPVKKYTAYVNQGDEISITATNLGGPDGILAKIIWTDASGQVQTTYTNAENWYCDSKSAASAGLNGVAPWGIIPDIGPQAQWIWNPAHPATTTCKTHIGGSSKKCKK
jgi:hypothetical protein